MVSSPGIINIYGTGDDQPAWGGFELENESRRKHELECPRAGPELNNDGALYEMNAAVHEVEGSIVPEVESKKLEPGVENKAMRDEIRQSEGSSARTMRNSRTGLSERSKDEAGSSRLSKPNMRVGARSSPVRKTGFGRKEVVTNPPRRNSSVVASEPPIENLCDASDDENVSR